MRIQTLSALLILSCVVSPSIATSAVPLSEEPGRFLYQVYVDNFYDSKSDTHGDFAGLIQKLDYFQKLSVDGLMIMPVFEADDGMGYIPFDFWTLRGDYAGTGTNQERDAEFVRLLNEAHQRGIKIFLDIPINHISKQSEWFKASASKKPGFEDDFLWADHPLEGWKIPWDPKSTPNDVWFLDKVRQAYYYALFGWGMPEMNHRNDHVVAEVNRIFEHYAALGVDGFRIDAAKHLLEGKTNNEGFVADNIPLLRNYLSTLRARFPAQSFLLEVWSGYDEIEAFPRTSGDVKFDFPYMDSLRDSLKWNHPYGVRNTLGHMVDTQSLLLPGERIVFAGNHDVPRLRTHVENDQPKQELALALTLTLPYIPLVYYGDEIGMVGNYIRYPDHPIDNLNEACMPMLWTPDTNAGFTTPEATLPVAWNKKIQPDWRQTNVQTESQNPHSLLSWVQRLGAFRKMMPLDNGARFAVDRTNSDDPVLKTAQTFSDGSCLVGLYNFSSVRQNRRPIAYSGICETQQSSLVQVISKRTFSREAGFVDLDPYGVSVVLLKPKKK